MPGQTKNGLDPDQVDAMRARWARELPNVDTGAMRVLARVRRIAMLSRLLTDVVYARHGLDLGEFEVIGELLASGPPYTLRPTELYTTLKISSGGLTNRLIRLNKAGLINRIPSSEDGRSLVVELSEAGRRCAEAAFRDEMAFETDLMEALEPDEVEQLERLLRRVGLLVEDKFKGRTAAG